jgi:hypothetical protein
MDSVFLVSTELREPYKPRRCSIIKRLRSEIRDDLALVEVEPPIESRIYDTTKELQRLILASRLEGSSIFPVVSEWPLYVYICVLNGENEPEGDAIDSKDLVILDWGKIVNDLRLI